MFILVSEKNNSFLTFKYDMIWELVKIFLNMLNPFPYNNKYFEQTIKIGKKRIVFIFVQFFLRFSRVDERENQYLTS